MLAGAKDFRRACEFARGAQRRAESEERAGVVVGRKTERERAFVVRDRLGGAAEHIAGPRELVGDLGDIRETRVEFLEQPEHVLDLSAVAGADDGFEFGFPGGHK